MDNSKKEVILKVVDLKQHFKTGIGKYKIYNKAVDGVSFEVRKGEVFSLVGESGCGKTTTGRTIMKIYKPTDGEVYLLGKRIVAGTLGCKQDIKDIKVKMSSDIKEVKLNSNLNNVEKSKKINVLKLEAKEKINALRDEIKQRNIDQKTKYRPSKEDVAEVRLEAKEGIKDLREKIKVANEDFLKFKAQAFTKSDGLPAGTSADEKFKIHNQEISKYREERAKKNALVKEYQIEIVHHLTSPKLYNRPLLNKMQMVFQDPIDSLNPRMNVKDIIAESLYINGIKHDDIVLEKVYEVLQLVGLQPEHADHYPHEFSGGQRQRVGIARAIISEPKIIIADEPISALDVSIQAQVINLLNELRYKLGLTILFIAHDLSVVKFLSDRVGIMYFGKIVEMGDKDKVFNNPLHPYTLSLISSIPMPDPNFERARKGISKYDPSKHDYSVDKPELREIEPEHFVYCNEAEYQKYKKIIAESNKKN